MIASVAGRVAALTAEAAVVEVGGFGVSVLCTPRTLARLRVGEQAHLTTALVVREESLTLYGFADEAERNAFDVLQTASGVGPKLAQAVLAVLTPAEIRQAVVTDDVTLLTRVPGIGRKGAQRIVLELAERVGVLAAGGAADVPAARPAAVDAAAGWQQHVRDALVGLGYPARDADDAVARVAADAAVDGETLDSSSGLRRALTALSRT